MTAFTYQNGDATDPPITVYPRPGLTGQAECGIRGQRWFAGAFFEAMSWAQSNIAHTIVETSGGPVLDVVLQPESRMFTVGLKTGVMF